jgi:hypothetical protein
VVRVTVERGEGRPEAYLFEGREVPSVTTVLPDRGDNENLLTWAGRQAIRAAYRMQLEQSDIDCDSARFWAAAKAHIDVRDEAGVQGTFVHEAIQSHILGDDEGVRAALWAAPDGGCALACLDAYREWEADLGARIRWTAIEVPLVTKYLAGTPDMWGIDLDRNTLIGGDIKSGKYITKKVGKQLGLYRWLLRKVRGIEWEDAIVLHFHAHRDDDGEIVVKKSTPRFGGAFLDQYERTGIAELKGYHEDQKCPVLPGMWA